MTGLRSRKQDRLPSRQPERRRRSIPGGGTVVPRRLQTAPAGTLFLVRDFRLASGTTARLPDSIHSGGRAAAG